MDAHHDPRLVLEVEDHTAEICPQQAEEDGEFYLGRDAANDFVYGSQLASRRHARIERRHKDYYLVDCSTNGTYVQTEDERVTHVHRDTVKLWGQGWISLGQPLNLGRPIHFRQG